MHDPLADRRKLAMAAAFNGFFLYPLFIAILSFHFKVSDELCKHLLNYMGITMLAPIMGYLYSAHINQQKEGKDDTNNKT